jgi:hypothetical protein
VFVVLRACIRAMLEQHAYDLDPLVSRCRYMQRGSAFAVLRACIRAMFEQHACDLDTPVFRRYM